MNGFSGTCEQQTELETEKTGKKRNCKREKRKKRNCELKNGTKKEQKTEKKQNGKNGILPNPFLQSSELKNGICFDVKTPITICSWPWKRMRLSISVWNRFCLSPASGKGGRVCFLYFHFQHLTSLSPISHVLWIRLSRWCLPHWALLVACEN